MTFKAALLALTVPFVLALPAAACSCLGYETAEQQFESSGVVFIGHVLDTGPVKQNRSLWDMLAVWRPKPNPLNATYVTTFQVDRMLKGPSVTSIQFTHDGPAKSSMCGVGFRPLESGVFIGYSDSEGGYATSLCAQAQFTEDAFLTLATPE